MLISVITVTYNALPALKQTLQSVWEQTYPEVECIVVDGASTDGTPQYLASLKPTIPLIYTSAPDQGIYDAMNKGVAMAHGEYCIFMNAADTFVGPQVLTEVVAQGLTADVVYGDIQKEGIVRPAAKPHNSHRMYYCHQAAFTRTQCLREFPFDINHRMSADFKQSKQLFLAGKTFRHIPVVITAYDTSGISNTRRSAGLLDNIKVIRETDSWTEQVRLLPRLLFTYISCKLRGK
jgi:glycosyltransferase involved in cell wall biosynthesis